MEKITIKLNLKLFVEDLLFANISGDEELVKELNEKFDSFFSHQTVELKGNILHYLMTYSVVKENQCLIKYFGKFLCKI